MFLSVTAYVVVFTVISNLFISYIVWRKDFKSATNFVLGFLSLLLASWAVCNFLALRIGPEETRLFWVRVVMFITTPFGPSVFLLASAFPGSKLNVGKLTLFFIFLSNLAIALLAFTPYMFASLINNPDGSFQLFPGPAIVAYGINLFFFLTWGIIRLIKKYKKSEQVEKKKLGMFLLGTGLSFTLMTLTNFIAVVVFQSIQLTSLGPPSTLIMVGFIAYAIVKHQLFNIKVIATEVFTLLILLVLFSRLVVSTGDELVVNSLVFVLMIVFGFQLIRSVSDEITQRQQLVELTSRLQELDARKDEFLSIAAHELRAPMTAIKGYISMLLEGDAGELPPDAIEYLKVTSKSNDRLIRLVNNLLNVSRIEEGRQVYQMGVLELVPVVKSVFDEFKFTAEGKGLKYTLDMGATMPEDRVYVDKDRVYEIVSNFISNAIKYTDTGSILVKLYTSRIGFIKMEVSDTGQGIALVDQKKLFQKYYRVDAAVGRAVGTGLGLYISKLLVEKFGGQVGFSSQEGKGSTFWFELPTMHEAIQRPNIMV